VTLLNKHSRSFYENKPDFNSQYFVEIGLFSDKLSQTTYLYENYFMIDEIDRKILIELQNDCRQPLSELSEKAGLSASACHRRIKILEENGTIERYAARLSGESLGYNMTFYVEVTLEGQSETILSTFEAAALARPEVLECHLMTGSADYLIKVAAPNTKDYERLYRRTISSLPHVNRIQSSLVMKTIKRWNGYPPNML